MAKKKKHPEKNGPVHQFVLSSPWKSKTSWLKLGYQVENEEHSVVLSFKTPRGSKDYDAYHAVHVKPRRKIWKELCKLAEWEHLENDEYNKPDIYVLYDRLLDLGKEKDVKILKYSLVTEEQYQIDLKKYEKAREKREEKERLEIERERKREEQRHIKELNFRRKHAKSKARELMDVALTGQTRFVGMLPKGFDCENKELMIDCLTSQNGKFDPAWELTVTKTRKGKFRVEVITYEAKGKAADYWQKFADAEGELNDQIINEIYGSIW